MTDERKNEIWAMLPSDFKELVTKTYQTEIPYDAYGHDRRAPEYRRQAEGGLYMLEFLFGIHNLTAQPTETTQESPSDIENEPNLSDSERETTQKSQSAVDYSQYRLDLAKEIAIALINNNDKNTRYGDILAYDAVKIANEMVAQLKNTKNERD